MCLVSIIVPTAVGLLAKETAVMLPLFALLVEACLFGFRTPDNPAYEKAGRVQDLRVWAMFLVTLVLPCIVGLSWLLPKILQHDAWATRGFTLGTRLLSESRVVVDYVAWTLFPTPSALSFYHDDFSISTGLVTPWSTLGSIMCISAFIALAIWLRHRQPLATLGIGLYFGAHLLTATFLPLELIYEHRNYFASLGLLLALASLLQAAWLHGASKGQFTTALSIVSGTLYLSWIAQTALSSAAWGDPLQLAIELAQRAPTSPRAQYELGRTFIIYSKYDPTSRFTSMAYAPLERAAKIPGASILPEQALIFFNARMHKPIEDSWWESLTSKLLRQAVTVQDESALGALAKCSEEKNCDLSHTRMTKAFEAALSHPHTTARLYAIYADYAWNGLEDRDLAIKMIELAVNTSPVEPAYRITWARMLTARGDQKGAQRQLDALERLNVGGSLNSDITSLKSKLPTRN
jgi:hypothetical protein